MRAHVYELKCITNLHVGSGDENYNIVDNEVERDPVTEMPTIFSSGVKGAVREFLEQKAKTDKELEAIIKKTLGFEEVQGGKKVTGPGSYRFLPAQFIARPLRISKGTGAYVLTAVKECMEDYLEMLSDLGKNPYEGELPDFGTEKTKGIILTNKKEIRVEGMETKNVPGNALMEKILGAAWAVTDKETMKDFSLPVQARNVLDDKGISQNLWYEEVVPHKSIFHMVIVTPDETNELDPYIDGEVIQFGADASIGYGLCKVTKIC